MSFGLHFPWLIKNYLKFTLNFILSIVFYESKFFNLRLSKSSIHYSIYFIMKKTSKTQASQQLL